jgi:hypothetical protein
MTVIHLSAEERGWETDQRLDSQRCVSTQSSAFFILTHSKLYQPTIDLNRFSPRRWHAEHNAISELASD